MNGVLKQASLWIVIMIILVLVVMNFGGVSNAKKPLGEAEFDAELRAGNVEKVVATPIGPDLLEVSAKLRSEVEGNKSIKFEWNKTDEALTAWKEVAKAENTVWEGKRESTLWQGLLINIIPLVLIFGLIWFFMFRQMQGGSNKAMSFGKSRAKLMNQSDKVASFEDVAGVDEAKEELQEVIEFLKDPKRFTTLGGKIPRGVLLVGPPGSGKTLLARAVAGEANVPFFSISGSDFVEMFVGVGASRVRDLFQQGHKHAPCIIFIDEIDAVGRQRGAGLGGGHDEREQTLNQLLVEMDGFNTNDGVILMAATNRPDVLDRALLRPGRFDRQVTVANPDIRGRQAILDIHIRNQKVPLDGDVDLRRLARGTPGFSGADLGNMVNEAALLAARRSQEVVTAQDFEDAKDRVIMGPARRSLVLTPEEKRNTAYHEAGHALVGRLLPAADPVHKATIIPRGPSLGLTSFLPEEDRHGASKKWCLANIRMTMGGRAAEELIFKEYTSGCAADLQQATKLAHSMVCEWGMSDLGPIAFGQESEVFLGRDFTKSRDFSDETASAVDREVHRILEEAYNDARELLEKHEHILRALAEALFERETLEMDEIDAIIRESGGAGLVPPPAPKKEEEEPPSQGGTVVPAGAVEEDGKEPAGDLPPGDIVPGTA